MTQDFGTPVTPIQEIPPVTPKKNNRTIWIIVAVVVVLLCCCCIVVGVVAAQNAGLIQNMINGFNNGMNGGGY
jgi:preprotein translocase subunit SecY